MENASYFTLIKSCFLNRHQDFIVYIFLGCIAATSTPLISIFSGYVFLHIDEMCQPGHVFLSVLFLFILLCFSIIFYANSMLVKSMTTKTISSVLPSLLDHLFQLPLKSTKLLPSADLAKRLLDYEAAILAVLKISSSILFNLLALVLLFSYMAYCNGFLTISYLILCFFLSSIKFYSLATSINHLSGQLAEQGKLYSLLNEAFLHIFKIRAANLEKLISKKCLHQLACSKFHEEQLARIEILTWALDAVIPLGIVLLCFMALYFSFENSRSINLLQFIFPAIQFLTVFRKLSTDFISLTHFLPYFKRMHAIISLQSETDHDRKHIDFKGGITLSHVSFKNTLTGQSILEDISLAIQPGEFIAFVGRTGAGKSSLFKSLLGLEPISSGIILMDGENINHLNRHSLRKQFGVVLQTTDLFPGTLLSNISANAQLTLDQAWELARLVKLDEEINLMPMKMNTYLSDHASESLSGGQKQKILIARALATRPRVLLLDEATSALDTQSQAHIYQSLKQLNITRIVIAHRYSSIVDADRIYVLEQGKITHQGTYRELQAILRFN